MTNIAARPNDVTHDKYEHLVKRAQTLGTIKAAIVHPCDNVSLEGAVEAARLRLIEPVLVGLGRAYPAEWPTMPVAISALWRSCPRNTATTPLRKPSRW